MPTKAWKISGSTAATKSSQEKNALRKSLNIKDLRTAGGGLRKSLIIKYLQTLVKFYCFYGIIFEACYLAIIVIVGIFLLFTHCYLAIMLYLGEYLPYLGELGKPATCTRKSF